MWPKQFTKLFFHQPNRMCQYKFRESINLCRVNRCKQLCDASSYYCILSQKRCVSDDIREDRPSMSRVMNKNTSGLSHANTTDVDPDSDIQPLLSTVTRDQSTVQTFSEVVPGKGAPPEPPVDCCMSGCANCVWILYAEELRKYYKDGNERALKEINKMENASLKAFIKIELGLV